MTEEEKKVEEVKKVAKTTFNLEAYKTYTSLHFAAKLRKGGKLSKEDTEKYNNAKKLAFANKGKKALKTDTYRVGHIKVQLVEGLSTPDSIVKLFSKEGQKILFS